ncbi:MAG: hypothetical protein KDC10_04595 [Calditrichaeota bacterium]|nr:hypothetical protein [Candidatus Cloacimonadota bacterium]MCA9787479.1 hypothetical protein [Candidatus Cloacimonadota bacterium]MCB1046461.1 hypothetical protein [Calditrichota bacterium]MCB9474879.1 hypothetical protein [Candidatus Delongbacteria bacterium]
MTSTLRSILLVLCCVLQAGAQQSLRVLFIGNSHTYYNDLPGMVADLADAGGHFLQHGQSTPGGFAWSQHVEHANTLEAIADPEGWDWVVLQEQSQMPVIPWYRENSSRPAAATLDSLIGAAGAQTLFYMTWGWRLGGQQCIGDECSTPFADYDEMQDSVSAAYFSFGQQFQATVAPAGLAWQLAHAERPLLGLWAADNYHPAVSGTFLAACTIVATLFDENVSDWPWAAGLDPELASFLRQQADLAVAQAQQTALNPRPSSFSVVSVTPNPFNPATRFHWVNGNGAAVRLVLYNLRGQRVRTLVDHWLPAGEQQLVWDGTDDRGHALPSGIFLYDMQARGERASGRVTLLR